MGKSIFRKLEKALRKPWKVVAPIAGAALGTMIGGPAGAVIGSGLGKSATSHHNMGKNFVRGLPTGLAYAAMAPTIAGQMGATPASWMGKFAGLGHGSLLSQLGMANAPAMGGGIGLWGNMGQQGMVPQWLNGAGIMGGAPAVAGASTIPGAPPGTPPIVAAPGGGSFFNNPWNLVGGGLGALALVGGMKKKNKEAEPKDYAAEIKRLEAAQPKLDIIPPEKYRKYRRRKAVRPESNPYGDWYEYGPEEDYATGGYARGGREHMEHRVHQGYIDGHSPGQKDDRKTNIREGSYVMDATTVAFLGDGNSKAGARKVAELEAKGLDKAMRSGIVRNPQESSNHRIMRVALSDGEYAISPDAVAGLGKGNNRQGAKVLDGVRKNVRKHVGFEKLLVPKSKPISRYMRGDR